MCDASKRSAPSSAVAMGVTQPAVSAQKIERELGFPPFDPVTDD